MVFTNLARKIAFFPGVVLSLKNALPLWRNAYFHTKRGTENDTCGSSTVDGGNLAPVLRHVI